jgi:N-acetylmuramoyl-L-alanine amidase
LALTFIDAPSPNFDVRSAPPDMVVIHYTGMPTGEAALAKLCDPTPPRVSSHWMIETDGRLFRLVPEERRAWHAGVSFWKGQASLNDASIGIELVNPGHEFGYLDFPEAQIATLIALLGEIRERWTVPDGRILGHSDIAPNRKVDPGERFPWARLAAAGHGLWVEQAPSPGPPLAQGEKGTGVFALQAGLTRLGFDCAPSGDFDAETKTVVEAFQRHWRPERVDGVADGETRARLVGLLRLL